VLGRLSRENLAAAVELAVLPDQVRGYEEIKLERAAAYRDRLAQGLAAFGERAMESASARDRDRHAADL